MHRVCASTVLHPSIRNCRHPGRYQRAAAQDAVYCIAGIFTGFFLNEREKVGENGKSVFFRTAISVSQNRLNRLYNSMTLFLRIAR
jgi:hypothetical protein